MTTSCDEIEYLTIEEALEINFAGLPSVSFDKRGDLPSTQGIYFVWGNEYLQYIGKATNLYKRWKNHHRLKEFRGMMKVKIFYLELDTTEAYLLSATEKEFIKKYNPHLNNKSQNSYGINFSKPKPKKHDRHYLDRYETDPRLTLELLDRVPGIGGCILEPCAGNHAISQVLSAELGESIIATNDIDPTLKHHYNLDATKPETWEAIANNPIWHCDPNGSESSWVLTSSPPYFVEGGDSTGKRLN